MEVQRGWGAIITSSHNAHQTDENKNRKTKIWQAMVWIGHSVEEFDGRRHKCECEGELSVACVCGRGVLSIKMHTLALHLFWVASRKRCVLFFSVTPSICHRICWTHVAGWHSRRVQRFTGDAPPTDFSFYDFIHTILANSAHRRIMNEQWWMRLELGYRELA